MTPSRLTTEHVREEYRRQSDQIRDYEYARWLRTRRDWEDYRMMYAFLDAELEDAPLTEVLEVGPGPGTWTRLLLGKAPDAHCVLVDVSETMLAQAMVRLGRRHQLTYVAQDFLETDIQGRSFLLSARALEYVPDKLAFVARARQALRPGGQGLVITKNPGFFGRALGRRIGRSNPLLHTEQIDARSLTALLTEAGFVDVQTRPVVIRLPYRLRLHGLGRLLWCGLRRTGLNAFTTLFCEAYAVRFAAPDPRR
ncbi:MAG: class I SAM-dependent methyltransferase [Planctomycetota bacterium]